MNKIFFVDTETTGLDPDINGVHQVSGILIINGKEEEELNLKFKPLRTEMIEPSALSVSGLTKEDLDSRGMSSGGAYKIFDKTICKYVNKFEKNDKMIIAGYNSHFDAQMLNSWYLKHRNRYFFGLFHGGVYLDGLNLALLYELRMGRRIFFPDRKLGTVAKHFGVELIGAHDALADIRATRQVIKILWGLVVK